MGLQFKVIVALVLLLIGQFFYMDYLKNKSENEKRELRNEIVSKDSVIKEKDGTYTRLSYEFTSQKEMFNKLKGQNAQLAKDIKDKDERIAYLNSITVKPETVFVNVTTDVRDSVAYFSGYSRPYTINGEFHLRDLKARNLDVLMDEFKLLVIGSKLENGFYRARLKFTDKNNQDLSMFKVMDIESAVNTDINTNEPPFLNVGFGGEISTGEIKVGMLLNLYGKNAFIINYQIMNQEILRNSVSVGYYRMLF